MIPTLNNLENLVVTVDYSLTPGEMAKATRCGTLFAGKKLNLDPLLSFSEESAMIAESMGTFTQQKMIGGIEIIIGNYDYYHSGLGISKELTAFGYRWANFGELMALATQYPKKQIEHGSIIGCGPIFPTYNYVTIEPYTFKGHTYEYLSGFELHGLKTREIRRKRLYALKDNMMQFEAYYPGQDPLATVIFPSSKIAIVKCD